MFYQSATERGLKTSVQLHSYNTSSCTAGNVQLHKNTSNCTAAYLKTKKYE